MADVNETLQQLLERRLRELGKRRGRGENLSLREVWQSLPEGPNGRRAVSYETVRRVRENGHTAIGDATADALATMLAVPVEDVLRAAGQRTRLQPFQLPQRADRLTENERGVVLGVVDAILGAAQAPTEESPRLRSVRSTEEGGAVAARRTRSGGPSAGQQRRRQLAEVGEEDQSAPEDES